jgi:hypothetical protein
MLAAHTALDGAKGSAHGPALAAVAAADDASHGRLIANFPGQPCGGSERLRRNILLNRNRIIAND